MTLFRDTASNEGSHDCSWWEASPHAPGCYAIPKGQDPVSPSPSPPAPPSWACLLLPPPHVRSCCPLLQKSPLVPPGALPVLRGFGPQLDGSHREAGLRFSKDPHSPPDGLPAAATPLGLHCWRGPVGCLQSHQPPGSAGTLFPLFSQLLSPKVKPMGPAQQVFCPPAPWGPENALKRDYPGYTHPQLPGLLHPST